MPESLKPWEIHPALTAERLGAVARIAWDVRVEAARDCKWHKGQNLWTIGCNAHAMMIHAYSLASFGELRDWLSIRQEGLYFLLKIGGVPIRGYSGDPTEEAPERYARAKASERSDLQWAFDLADTPTPEAYFRFVVTKDSRGFPLAVSLVQVDETGQVHNPWIIPVAQTRGVLRLEDVREKPVEIPPPTVLSERDERAREKEEQEKEKKEKKGDAEIGEA